MVRRTTIASFVVLGVLWSAAAIADSKPAVAVLGLEVISQGTEVDEEAARFAAALTAGLRHRAMLGKGPFQLAPNSNKDLLELKLLSSCSDEGRECMSALGREMSAQKLLYGKVERRPDGYQVSLKLLDVDTEAMERTMSELVAFNQTNGNGAKEWARRLYNRLAGISEDGTIVVEANVDGGTVAIDGNVATALTKGNASISNIPEGTHRVTIEAAGYDRFEDTVTVTAGQESVISAILIRREGDGPVSPARPGRRARVLFWTSVVATGASATAWAITGLQVRGLEDDKQDQFAQLEANLNAAGFDLQAMYANGSDRFSDVCKIGEDVAANDALDGSARALAGDLNSTCDKGRSRALLTNILIGTTLAATAAATFFYYKGYMATSGEGRPASKDEPVVRISPTIGPKVVGAGLEVQF
jgi:hypothetical protein